MSIPGTAHPPGACEMAVMDMTGAIRLLCRVDSEQDYYDFAPVRSFSGGIEHTHVELDVRQVIFGEMIRSRGRIVERFGHDTPCFLLTEKRMPKV